MPLANKNKKTSRPALMVLYISDAGVGKTTAAMSFPNPLILDSESGTRHYEGSFDGAIIRSASFGEALRVTREIKSKGKATWKEGAETLEYTPKTLVADSMSGFWKALQAAKMQDSMTSQGLTVNSGTEQPTADKDSFRIWGAIKLHWDTWHSEFKSLGINIVATAHEKEEMKSQKNEYGKMTLMKTGEVIADTEKNYKYVFDLVLRLHFQDGKRYAIVLKSRLKNADGTDRFKLGEKLDKFDYEALTNGLSKDVSTKVEGETEGEALLKDQVVADKDPTSLKIAHEIRSKLAPAAGVSNEDLAAYCCAKIMKDGVTKFATLGADGKLHLSEVPADRLQWLADVLQSEKSLAALKAKIVELKGNQIPGLEVKTPELAEVK